MNDFDKGDRRLIFPKGLLAKIKAYAIGFKSMRETAEKFSEYGLTRNHLLDLNDKYVEVIEGDVERVTEV